MDHWILDIIHRLLNSICYSWDNKKILKFNDSVVK